MSDVNKVLAPFNAVNGHTASTVSATSTNGASGSVLLPVPSNSSGGIPPADATIGQILIYNSGTVAVFVTFGGSTIAATVPNGSVAGSTPVAPGAELVLTVSGNPAYAAAIALTGTATVYFTPGAGS